MARLEFCRQSSRDATFPQGTSERLVNLYPEPIPAGGRAAFALKAVPGTADFATLDGVFVRAIANVPSYDSDGRPNDRLLAVSGGYMRRIASDGTVTELAALPDDENTDFSGNNGDVTITAGGQYFIWDGSSLTEPAAGAFSAFGGVAFLGDYTVLTEKNDRRFCWSALTNASSLPTLNFATAEARDDVLVRPMAIGGNLWLFKTTSIEIWSLTGGTGADAFSRVGGLIETGLMAFGLAAKIPGGAFFIGNDGIAYLTGGTEALQPVSAPAVNEAIRAGTATSCFYYEDTGHKFCVIRFSDRPAWVYDLATGAWHERATGDDGAWGATGAVRAYGAWRLAGFNGFIRTALRSNDDAGEPLVRRATSGVLENGSALFRVPMIEVFGQMGRSDLGREAKVMLRLSRDGGMTWSPYREASMGALGGYSSRAVFRSCGQARMLTAEIRITDPADLTLLSAAEVQLS